MDMKNLNEMTMEEIKELAQEGLNHRNKSKKVNIPKSDALHPYTIGSNVLIRTVTMIQVGRLIWVGEQELVLEDASWIPDTGRFHKALEEGEKILDEVEPCSSIVIIGRGSIVDVYPWTNPLPRIAK